MRSISVLEDASVCQDADALQDPAVQTLEDVRRHDHADCPLIKVCSSGQLLSPQLRNCIPRMGQDVARFAAKAGGTVEQEMVDCRSAPVFAKMGFIDPYDNPDPDATVTDKDEICTKVADWAKRILDGVPPSLDEQVKTAHCGRHSSFVAGCRACGITRLRTADRTDVVLDRGVPKRVSRDRCRCPILNPGDFCPVHGG